MLHCVAKFSPTKLSQTEFLTNKGINSYLLTEGALDFSPTKRNLLFILEISHQPVGEKCHTIGCVRIPNRTKNTESA